MMTDVITVMGTHKNAFPIFKPSCLVRLHTNSHHNGYNKMIVAVYCAIYNETLTLKC